MSRAGEGLAPIIPPHGSGRTLCTSECSAPNCWRTSRAGGGNVWYQHATTTHPALIKQVAGLRTAWHNHQTSPFSAAAKSLPSLPKNDFIPKFDPGKKYSSPDFSSARSLTPQASKKGQLKTVVTSIQKKKRIPPMYAIMANLPDQGNNWRGRTSSFFFFESLRKERWVLVFLRGVFISGLSLRKSGSLYLPPYPLLRLHRLLTFHGPYPSWSLRFSSRGWFGLSFSYPHKSPSSGDFCFIPLNIHTSHPFSESSHSDASICNYWSLSYYLTFCATVRKDGKEFPNKWGVRHFNKQKKSKPYYYRKIHFYPNIYFSVSHLSSR